MVPYDTGSGATRRHFHTIWDARAYTLLQNYDIIHERGIEKSALRYEVSNKAVNGTA